MSDKLTVEELREMHEFTKEEIASKEKMIHEIESNFPKDLKEAENAVGLIFLHLLTLRQKEKVEESHLSTVERLEQAEEENKQMKEIVQRLEWSKLAFIGTHTEQVFCCPLCGGVKPSEHDKLGQEDKGFYIKGHSEACSIPKAQSFLAGG